MSQSNLARTESRKEGLAYQSSGNSQTCEVITKYTDWKPEGGEGAGQHLAPPQCSFPAIPPKDEILPGTIRQEGPWHGAHRGQFPKAGGRTESEAKEKANMNKST